MKECCEEVLPAWEQSYLKEIVFDRPAEVNFASVGYGEFDGSTKPFGSSYVLGSVSKSDSILTPSTSAFDMAKLSYHSPSVKSLTFGLSDLLRAKEQHRKEDPGFKVYYGEGSTEGKRPSEDEAGPSNAERPAQQVRQRSPDPSTAPKRKQKGKGRAKAEPQPLAGLFNEQSGRFDQPISVREILQATKVDLSWLDLIAWSPQIAKEFKRLCSKVPKKREPRRKKAEPISVNQEQPPFPAFVPQQMPPPIPTAQMPNPYLFQSQPLQPQPSQP